MTIMGSAHGRLEARSTGSSSGNGSSALGFGRCSVFPVPTLSATPTCEVSIHSAGSGRHRENDVADKVGTGRTGYRRRKSGPNSWPAMDDPYERHPTCERPLPGHTWAAQSPGTAWHHRTRAARHSPHSVALAVTSRALENAAAPLYPAPRADDSPPDGDPEPAEDGSPGNRTDYGSPLGELRRWESSRLLGEARTRMRRRCEAHPPTRGAPPLTQRGGSTRCRCAA